MKDYGILILSAIILAVAAIIRFTRKEKPDVEMEFNTTTDPSSILNALQGRMANNGNERGAGEKGIGIYLDIPLTTLIKNKTAREAVMQNMSGNLAYEGETILQSQSNSSQLQDVTVGAKSQKKITDTFQVLVNSKTIKFFQQLISGKKPKIKYVFNAIIAGKPYRITDDTFVNLSKS